MTHFEWLAIVMFVGFFFFIMSGYPVGYSFAATAILFGGIGYILGAFDLNLLKLLPSRWFGTMSDFTLLAIPFFIFMGAVFEKSGLAEELLETVGRLLGRVRGGLALAVILVGTLLAATTGVVAATIIMMGMLALPTMLRYGYDKQLATGVITASGTLAQMIPPSLVLVVLSDQIGVQIGDLFLGSIIPGLLIFGTLHVVRDRDHAPQTRPRACSSARSIFPRWKRIAAQSGTRDDPAGHSCVRCVGKYFLWAGVSHGSRECWRGGRMFSCMDEQTAELQIASRRCKIHSATDRAGYHDSILFHILQPGL